jgi:hypothetical protein
VTRVVAHEWRRNGRLVERGTELEIEGASGRWRFQAHVLTDAGEWIDVYGGTPSRPAFRSFDPGRVTTVHRLQKTRWDLPAPRPSRGIR